MKARQAYLLAAAGATLALGGTGATARAQETRTVRPDPNTPRFMVATFCSAEKKAGVDAADAVRKRLIDDISYKKLWTIQKNDIDATLEASGFPTNECLSPNDERILARQIRADEYLDGLVTRVGGGYRVNANLVLTRDNTLTQPLPAVQVGNPGAAAKQIAGAVQAARKQLESERRCANAVREGKYQDAIAAARQGISAYPNATLARLCLAQTYVSMKSSPDSILAVTNEVLRLDSLNKGALRLSAEAYRQKNQPEQQVNALSKLLAADPSNAAVLDELVRVLGASGKSANAVPIIRQALNEHPGDPSLTRTGFLIYLAARSWKDALATGQQLAQIDTAAMDTTYFQRLAAAYVADSQAQKALEVSARGVAKFPNSGQLWLVRAQLLRNAGQNQQALEATRRAIALNPKGGRQYLQLAQAQIDMNQPDSAYASLRAAAQQVSDSGDKSLLAQYAFAQGGTFYKRGQGTKDRADFQRAVKFLALSDSVTAAAQTKFFLGASALSVAQSALTEASKAKSCDLARLAAQSLTTAQINTTQGGASNPDAAKQVLAGVQQLEPYAARYQKAYCK